VTRKKSVDEIMAEFRRKMQRSADGSGSSITITSGGRSVAFAPKSASCPCCSEPGAPARPNTDSGEWVCDCSCHPREA